MSIKIHFVSDPFTARVDNEKDMYICTSGVYTYIPCDEHDLFSCGICVTYANKAAKWVDSTKEYGLYEPKDLIAAWRSAQILTHIDTIDIGILRAVYYSGFCYSDEKYMLPDIVKHTIEKIGKNTYKAIMEMQIPEEIINAILVSQDSDFVLDNNVRN